MKLKFLTSTLVLLCSIYAYVEIPEWYKRDIANHIEKADGVILYKILKLTKVSARGPYHSYRIDTETITALKGTAPAGECYMIHTEGEWKSPKKIGEKAIVILNTKYQSECGAIESGFGAPATQEYIDLFRSILAKSPNQSKQ